MSLEGHYQNAYVTRDLDAVVTAIGGVHGIESFRTIQAEFELSTPYGLRTAHMRVALGWAGRLQIELIQPLSGFTEVYLAGLPANPHDHSPRLHHVAVRRDDLDAMKAEIESLSEPVLFSGEGPGLSYVLVDARRSLGHCLEYVYATREGWAMVGWPS